MSYKNQIHPIAQQLAETMMAERGLTSDADLFQVLIVESSAHDTQRSFSKLLGDLNQDLANVQKPIGDLLTNS